MSLMTLAGRRRSRRSLECELLERREVMTAEQWSIAAGTYDLSQTLLLHSVPGAKQVIYLDFDGHTNGNVYGSSWDNLTSPAWDPSGNGPAFTTSEQQTIQRIWTRVAEDFAPFNVDVTTQDPGVEALRKSGLTDDRWGIRVVITPDDTPAPGSGGVSYVGAFNFNTDTPAYVFNTSEKSVAEAISHETGHALGLDHDGTATSEYYSGQGSGTTSWGPIMGAAYSPNVTQWSKGEYPGANNAEDDLNKITTLNGFTYRSDDVGNTQATAASLLPQGSSTVAATYGIIERNTDADYYSFYAGVGAITLNVDPQSLGANLAVRADLYNASGTLLTTVNPASALNALVSFNITAAGQYFLKVSGTGKGNVSTTGFSNYGSLGNYRITGTVTPFTGGGPTNTPPVANADTATTVSGVPVSVNVLANDTDANGDTLVITGVTSVVGGTAVVTGGVVVYTPNAGFSGTGTFTYSISDGKGGTATATATITVTAVSSTTQTFTNGTDVNISSVGTPTVTSSIAVTGLTGVLQDVDVKVSIYHTYVSDLTITLIAPDGTRILLFNRHGGSGDNLLNTNFDEAATTAIASGSAPFTGTFKPSVALAGLNGKVPNGTWKLEVKDNARQDGGRIDSWSLTVRTGATTSPAAPGIVPANSPSGSGGSTVVVASPFSVFGGVDVQALLTALQNDASVARLPLGRLTDAQVVSLLEEWFGIGREGDLPRL